MSHAHKDDAHAEHRAPRRAGRPEDLCDQVQRLLPRLRIAVIYGGDKSADGAVIHKTINTRSWKSYQAVAEDIGHSLKRNGCRHIYVLPEDMLLTQRLNEKSINLAWLNTGGVQGYNPMCHASAMLEMVGIPYVGHDPLTVSLLDNKHSFKRHLQALGLPTAPFITWHPSRCPAAPARLHRFRETFGDYSGPFVAKPVSGRASQHVHLVESEDELAEVVKDIYDATHNHVLIEKYLPGREFCIAVCGPVVAKAGKVGRHNQVFTFGAVERLLDADENIFTSMDLRPITVDRVRALEPTTDAVDLKQLEELAVEVFLELGLETLVRLDVRADSSGRMYVLEANPKPDLKAPTDNQTNLVCVGLSQYGMSYDDLILSLLADRIDLLFGERRGTVTNLTSLLK